MLCSVLLIQAAVNKLVVLGIEPGIVSQCEIREYPQRIGRHTAVGVKRKLIQFLLKTIVTRPVGRGAQLLDF